MRDSGERVRPGEGDRDPRRDQTDQRVAPTPPTLRSTRAVSTDTRGRVAAANEAGVGEDGIGGCDLSARRKRQNSHQSNTGHTRPDRRTAHTTANPEVII
jgi:hypothetical protein